MRSARPDSRISVMTLALNVGRCYGGAERIAFEFVKRLDPERFERHLCVTRAFPTADRRTQNEAELRELERSGAHVLRLEGRSVRPGPSWVRLYRLLAGGSIDVLHAHMPRASVPGTIVGRLARVPVIINQEHGWAFEGQPIRRFLDRNVVARGDVVIAVSERDRRSMIELEHIPPERIVVLHNGIAPTPLSGRDVRSELEVPPGTALIGAVGRLYPEKGYGDLIRAVALLRRERPQPLLCVIVGDGPERGALEALIDELGVADEVRLVGHRQDVQDVIGALDVAVLPSRNEGSPLALLEYMAGAAPIVASAVGGIGEMIEDGVHGLLAGPANPHDLALAIGRLLDDRALASRLGGAAQERQRAEFDLDAVLTRLQALYTETYESVITGQRARRRA